MFIKKRKKIICEIHSVNDFEKFIINENIYKFFIKFDLSSQEKIQEFISKTEFLNYKKVKPAIKSILNYPETIYNPNFLKLMGWEENDIIKFISNKQKNNSDKLSCLKKNNPEMFKDKTTTNVEYWLKKGYGLDDAKNKVSERQSTFSLKKCIDKYGNYEGEKIFKERQNKWITTLKNKKDFKEIQKNKNPYKYDKKNYRLILKHSNFKEKINKIVNYCFKHKNIHEFADCVLNKDDIKKYSDFAPYINSKIIQNYYKTNSIDLKNIIYSKLNLNQNKQYYGVSVYHKGIRYKSVGEYRVALFLEENCLNFEYEINYPESNMKCDFYLSDFDIYIELFGLLNKKNIEKLDNTLEFYRNKMLQKINFCEEKKIKMIYDSDQNKLIEKIKILL